MSTLNPTRKVSRRHELREDTVVTAYARALNVLENHTTMVYGVAGAIVLVVALFLGYNWNQNRQNETAMSEMAVAVQKYENGEYTASLEGDASFAGLVEIADRFGGTASGNLAHYYAGDAYFRTGDVDNALAHFEAYSKDANYLGASAFAGEAAAHELKGDHKKAGDLFMRAARVFKSEITSPIFLESAARAYSSAGDSRKATEAYQAIQDDFPDSASARNVDFFLAQINANS